MLWFKLEEIIHGYIFTINPRQEYGVHLRTKIIENKRQFEVQKLDYPHRNLVILI